VSIEVTMTGLLVSCILLVFVCWKLYQLEKRSKSISKPLLNGIKPSVEIFGDECDKNNESPESQTGNKPDNKPDDTGFSNRIYRFNDEINNEDKRKCS
jgi:hypothetical protein